MPANNPCPFPGCKNSKPYDHFSCKPHWFALPAAIRKKVGDGWREERFGAKWIEGQKEAFAFWKGKQ